MPFVQTLFYLFGVITFVLATIFFAVVLTMALSNYRRFRRVVDKFEDKMDAPLMTALTPFLPSIIALIGELKRGRRRR